MSERAAADGGEGRGPLPSTDAGPIAVPNASPTSGPSLSLGPSTPSYICGNGHLAATSEHCRHCHSAWLAATFPVFPVE